MSGEVIQSSDDANTLYFLVYRPNDSFIFDVGDSAFEAVGTWNDARVGECDIAMVSAGDAHFGNFPTVSPGTYFVQVRRRVGGAPAVTDFAEGQGEMYWDGTGEISWTTEQGIKWIKNG